MLFKKVIVVALSAVLTLPLAAQQADPFPKPGYAPVTELARLSAQQAPQPGTAAPSTESAEAEAEAEPASPPGKLKVEVLAGEGGENDIATGTVVAPKVRVLDEAGNPVEGAEVVFQLPMGGPSGVFSGWVRTQTLRTDVNGEAAVSAYAPNEIEGQFGIKVQAKSGNSEGAAIVQQTNIRSAPAKSNKKWIVAGAIAAGVAVAIVILATRGDDDDLEATPVSISAGPISVGSPNN